MRKNVDQLWHGLKVVGRSDLGPLVDPRDALPHMVPENERAKKEVKFTTKAALIGINSVGFTPSKSHADYTFPANSKAVNFRPDKNDSCWCCCAAYYVNGAWVAVHAGSHRKNQYVALHDQGDKLWTPTGATLKKPWCSPWGKEFPTICFSLSADKKTVTAAVGLEEAAYTNIETGEPEQAKRLLEIVLDGSVIHAMEI